MAWATRLFSIIEWCSIKYGDSLSRKDSVTSRQSIKLMVNRLCLEGTCAASIASEA